MRFFVLAVFFSVALLGAGCATSRVVEDTRHPEIVIDKFGVVTFQDKHVAPEKIASAVKSAGIPKGQKIRIFVPEARDHLLMRAIADNLMSAGYGTLFITDKKATAGTKTPSK